MGWELQQLPARVMFGLDGFPGIIIVLSKQESWEGRPGLPLIGDVALKPPHRSYAPGFGTLPPSSSLPRGFRLVPVHGHPTSPIVNMMGISCD